MSGGEAILPLLAIRRAANAGKVGVLEAPQAEPASAAGR